jgi:hypothetical protein
MSWGVFSGHIRSRMVLGTVNSGQFSAQCGSAHGSVFESVRRLSCSKIVKFGYNMDNYYWKVSI